MSLAADVTRTASHLRDLVANVERVIFGKTEAVELCAIALLAEGHVLLEDVPGTGKTSLARALARSVDLDFRRIQFTADLLPSDVLGVSVFSPGEERFVFQPGPIFGHVVLADELNRTTPRTQSALLECMEERRVSVDGEPRPLPRPFLLIATQNPAEFEGTYPLPESQLDRFLLRVQLGYPDREDERRIFRSRLEDDPLEGLSAVLERGALMLAIEAVKSVRVDEALVDYALDVVAATRSAPALALGASPRAGLAWLRAARAAAFLAGRDFATPDDLKRLAGPVLAHRLVAGAASGSEAALAEVLESVPIPD